MTTASSMDNYPWGPVNKVTIENSSMVYDQETISPEMEATIVVTLNHITISNGYFNNKLIAKKVLESLIIDLDEDDEDCI